ncbi:MAG: hypothetical protein ACTTJC_03710 [Campylobacter sp.]
MLKKVLFISFLADFILANLSLLDLKMSKEHVLYAVAEFKDKQ